MSDGLPGDDVIEKSTTVGGQVDPLVMCKVASKQEIENGNKCKWMGVKVADMERDDLIGFIGSLDYFISEVFSEKLKYWKERTAIAEDRNDALIGEIGKLKGYKPLSI